MIYILINNVELPSHNRTLIRTYFPSLTSMEFFWFTEIITTIITTTYTLLMSCNDWNSLENRHRNISYHPEAIWQNNPFSNTFFHFLIIELYNYLFNFSLITFAMQNYHLIYFLQSNFWEILFNIPQIHLKLFVTQTNTPPKNFDKLSRFCPLRLNISV